MKISKLLAAIFCLGLFILAACTPTAQNKALVLDEVQVESSYVTPMQDEDYSKQQIQGAKYYFSSSEGSLNGTGSMESPWSDFSKLEQLQLQPGDGVYLKCGDVFENQALSIKNSGTKEAPITISSYGTGEYPIILGGGEVYDKVLSLVPSFTARVGINLKNVTGVSIRGIAIYSAEFGVWSRSDTIQDPAPFVIEDCIFQDIFPDAVKIGMVSNIETIQMIASKLQQYGAKNIVIDPVMVSTSGCALMSPDAMDTLIETLLPLGDVITPNIPEAEKLCGFEITTIEDMVRAAEVIGKNLNGSILIKGGHLTETADDLLWHQGNIHWYHGERVDNPNTHGTGCTLSSAVASRLAMGYPVEESIRLAKTYITGALKDGLNLGAGSGPLNHCFCL